MKRILSVLILSGVSSVFSVAQAIDAGTSRGRAAMITPSETIQTGWAGYLGVNAGYTNYNPNLNVEGAPTSLKILGSYVTMDSMLVFDAGYGIQNQTFSQKAAIDGGISTGVGELAARYQFENRWQLGAIYNQFFSKGENYGANQADAQFAGAQILREFSFSREFIGRVGARVMTSINVSNESVNMALIDFQVGWGGPARSVSKLNR